MQLVPSLSGLPCDAVDQHWRGVPGSIRLPPMTIFKWVTIGALSGAVVGGVIATLITPGLLEWYNTPAVGQALCSCPEVARATARGLVRGQLIGMSLGGVAFSVAFGLVARARLANKQGPTAPPA